MPRTAPTRKERFAAACRRAGTTQREWAAGRDVTYTHLYLVLRGDRQSDRLNDQVDAFIAEQEDAAATAA